MHRRLLILALVLTAGACGASAPESAPGAVLADLAVYEGADREQRLLEGARREGELAVYTSAQSNDLGAVVEAFEKKYGLTATVWRAGSEAVLNRALQE